MSDEHQTTEPDDAEFLDLILETDLANIIKKAQGGLPLTKREREMIEEERTRRQKTPPETAFSLEGEGAIAELERLTQRELAELWGYSLRQVKNWIHDGREKSDPAPVTRPAEMPAWFQRVYAPRDCPEKLRGAAERILAGHVPTSKTNEAPRAPTDRVEIADEEKGLLAMLDRYRTAEVTLHNKYMAAVDAGDERLSGFYLREWSNMGEKVRSLEKTAPKALEELGIYVRRADIQRELEPLHASIIKAFRQGFRMARPKLKACATTEEWSLEVDKVVDDVARMLADTDFAETLELDAA